MKIIKDKKAAGYLQGTYQFGCGGAVYRVQGTEITIEQVAYRWIVKRDGQIIRRWDYLTFAKEHALSLAEGN